MADAQSPAGDRLPAARHPRHSEQGAEGELGPEDDAGEPACGRCADGRFLGIVLDVERSGVLPAVRHADGVQGGAEVIVAVVGDLYFRVQVSCGKSWPGMRHSEDAGILLERAMNHEESCLACQSAKPAEVVL